MTTPQTMHTLNQTMNASWTFRVAHQGGTFVRPTDAYLNRIKAAIRRLGLPPEALDIVDAAARPPGKPSIST